MDLKIKLEISNLVKKGIPEEVAFLTTVVKYKKEYLHLFNIFSGILFVSGYIYVLTKKPKT
jgi:hypothetical protein